MVLILNENHQAGKAENDLELVVLHRQHFGFGGVQ